MKPPQQQQRKAPARSPRANPTLVPATTALQGRRSLRQILLQFLTPAVWKQAQQQRQQKKASPRWKTQGLVLVLLFMTWCSGDSQAERFEVAKAYCQAVWFVKRRGLGKTVPGFQKALSRLPLAVLRTVTLAVRRLLGQRLAARWEYQGFVPIGCDGSRVRCPRSTELESRLGAAGKDQSAPSLWVTALVHLRWGVPLAWRFGKSNADERGHLRWLVRTLPPLALVVADAGYVGFPLTQYLVQNDVLFLLRMCSNAKLYTAKQVALERYREGIVYYWPSQKDGKAGALPLRLRLIRIRARRRKHDVWLLTNVLDRQRLRSSLAGQLYRWRWQSEGCFRTYKHTLKKVKLVSRTLRLVHREAEGSWLALQLLMAQGVLVQQHQRVRRAAARKQAQPRQAPSTAPRPTKAPSAAALPCSPRQILLAIRKEMNGPAQRGEACYEQRLRQARVERRARTSAKASKNWPRRKPHKPPKPPQLRELDGEQKAVLATRCSKAS